MGEYESYRPDAPVSRNRRTSRSKTRNSCASFHASTGADATLAPFKELLPFAFEQRIMGDFSQTPLSFTWVSIMERSKHALSKIQQQLKALPMRFDLIVLGTSTLALTTLTGCIPQTQYDDLMTNNRSLKQQVAQLQGELDTSTANEEMLRKQLAEAAADLLKAKTLAGASDADIQALTDRYNALLGQVNALDVLPSDVSAALEEIAASSGGLLTFDKAKGMLRFSSDVTFDSGSAQLTDKAKGVLAQVATVLNGSSATSLEVQVVGHTDNVGIRRAATAAAHPTNMHLSAHRAISVREALVADGVGASRFMVAGYGEFRPVSENTAKGSQANRRVELYLKPSTDSGTTATAAKTTESATTAPTPVATTTDDDNVK